jgi:hypothetical protein
MLSRSAWARVAALTSAFAIVSLAFPVGATFAQEAPSVALEQARKGEDGTTGAGATPGNMESGGSRRDGNGNGENATAGGAGEVATADGSSDAAGSGGGAPLPENAELLDALGILDDVTTYGIDVLVGMDIPVELLPPAAVEATETAPEEAATAPVDVNTGGQTGSDSAISTEPGDGSAPAGGSTNSASADGVGATDTGEKKRDRPNKDAAGTTDTATTGDGVTETTTTTNDGGSSTGS